MRIAARFSRAAILLALFAGSISRSDAIDLTGAWATDASVCDKLFVKKGKGLSFKSSSELYGGGFIVDGNLLRGKAVKCTIKARKEDGSLLHLMASCASDIMLSNVQFSLKVVDEHTISRIFPGMEGMEITYYRCSL